MLNQSFIILMLGFMVQVQADDPDPKTPKYTSISTDGQCRLFTQNIAFTKRELDPTTTNRYIIQRIDVTGDALLLDQSGGDCTNLNGSIILVYGPLQGRKTDLKLDSFELVLTLNYTRKYQWWQVEQIDLKATGSFISADPKSNHVEITWKGPVMKSLAIGANKQFNYACSKTNQLFYDVSKEVTYGLQFENFQLQPFYYENGKARAGNFTANVDDCVGFFTPGIWMFLFSMSVFILILIGSLAMLANMKSVNRFDDPKGKPLTFIVQE